MIPSDRWRGPGSGTFVDMVYLLDDHITVAEIWDIVTQSGFTPIPYRYPKGHPLQGKVVQDKFTVEEINIGVEPIQTLTPEELNAGGYYQQQGGYYG